MATAALSVGAILVICVLALLAPDQRHRIITPALIAPIAALSWWLVYRQRTAAGIALLTYGSWATATGGALAFGGVRATIIVAYPLMIMFSGWLIGSRSVVLLTLMSLGAITAFVAFEPWLPPPPPTPSAMFWVIQAVIFVLSGAMIHFFLRHQRDQVDQVRILTADLERERAEAAAAESLRRHKELLDHTGRLARVGGWEFDVGTKALAWTDETFRLHDLEPGTVPGLDEAIAFYPPEARPPLQEAVRRAIDEGVGYDLELPLDTARGRRIWVRTIGQPQFQDGRVVRLSGALQDITEHRQADKQLEASLNNLECTLQATDDGIFGYDGSDPRGHLLFANRRFFEIWKMDAAMAETTTRADVIAAARKLLPDPEAGVRRIEEILALGEVHEDKVHLNDGRVLFRRSIPLLEGSQVSRVWSFRDITAEERSKAELQASRDEAERANTAKSEFLSRMSHELRTPMHAIMGMMSLARRRMPDPQGLEQLDKAKAAADHLLSLINEILDISKIEAGRLELEQVDFRIDDVLRNMLNLVGNRAAEKGLRLLVDQRIGGADPVLRGDPLRLGQVLLNIVGNAIKFSAHGAIQIRIRRVQDVVDGVLLRFEVEDQGIGIETGEIDRLFQAFEQADGSMTRKFGGSGLGLAISKRLVQMMGGEIGVDSRPGEGSTFWFTAWLGTAQSAPIEAPPPLQSAEHRLRRDFSGARVLLADDDPTGREIVNDLLRATSLAIDLAEDGKEALQHARERRYDLILMDMQMPNLNGIEATRAIRADSINAATPIVAMTANAFEEDRRVCLAAGMNDHIGKPVDADTLFLTLLHWLQQPRAES